LEQLNRHFLSDAGPPNHLNPFVLFPFVNVCIQFFGFHCKPVNDWFCLVKGIVKQCKNDVGADEGFAVLDEEVYFTDGLGSNLLYLDFIKHFRKTERFTEHFA
jgi:hypothetical protein